MKCDRCAQEIDEGPLVSLGSRRQFHNLCRTCWTQETRNSNSRLISALNELSRADREEGARELAADSGDETARGRTRGAPRGRQDASTSERGQNHAPADTPESYSARDRTAEDRTARDRTEKDGRERRSDPTRPQWHS